MVITVTFTGETLQPGTNKWYVVAIAKSDKKLPKERNIGYNTFVFVDSVDFVINGQRPVLNKESNEKFTYHGCGVHLFEPDGTKRVLNYYNSIENKTGKIFRERLEV